MKSINKRLIVIFIVFFTITILASKFIGIKGIASFGSSNTYSWSEINSNLLIYLAFSLIFAFVFNNIIEWAENIDKKSIEDARKRIQEREQKEREQKEREQIKKGSKSDNQEIK